MKLVYYLFLFLLFFFAVSCDTTETLPEAGIGLTLEDVSCTEAWITLTVVDLSSTAYIQIKQNGTLINTQKVNSTLTPIFIDSLKPKTNYTFEAFSYQRGKEIKSNVLNFSTLDTTSHNFTWQTFEFGQHSSSVLYDVAIIDENNIWAVGEIYMNDSLGRPDPIAYNAVYWDGNNWEIKKIGVTYNGNQTIASLRGVFVLPGGEIIFSSGLPYLPQGSGWKLFHLWDMGVLDQDDGSVYKIWGTSLNDLYFVGSKGTIVHYNGTNWRKIESGTSANINDVFGIIDTHLQEADVYCAVSFLFQSGDRKILHIKNNKVDSLSWQSDKRINSIWTKNNRIFYTAGDGVFENKRNSWEQVRELPPYYSNNIRGNGLNDVFVCGDFGLFAHYNGETWKTYNELFIQGIYFSLDTNKNIAITVGFMGGKAVIALGTR